MKIIKLNAIDSTNSFLKNLSQDSTLENFTVVIAKEQTVGRGQHENKWQSEPHKNLTFSVFTNFLDLKITHKKYLNFAISLAIYDVLNSLEIKRLAIKWPNDIMAVNKKICGILIANTFKGDKIKNTVIGIGLNVNQEKFPINIKNATSLKLETLKEFNLDEILSKILKELQNKISFLNSKKYSFLEKEYLKVLYKKNIPTMFKNSRDEIFMGLIIGISKDGNLQIQLEDDSIKKFGIKEISIL